MQQNLLLFVFEDHANHAQNIKIIQKQLDI